MEWFAVLIPLIVIPIIKHYFPHKILWWECLIPVVPAIILIPTISSCSVMLVTQDTERHGGWLTEARYYEEWDEWITKTCSRQVRTGTDSKGNATYRTDYYDCSYREYHPAYWEAHGSNGEVISISQSQYELFVSKFGNKQFVDMYRSYHRIDGDMYKTVFPNKDELLVGLYTNHSYTNKVQASNGVFEFPEVDPETIKLLHQYPELANNFHDSAILGGSFPEADKKLQFLNAKFGRQLQIRYWILVFHNQPRSIGYDQESFWKGGNKNEFVVCLNLDGNKPSWSHVFCWSPDGHTGNDVAKIKVRDYIESQKDLNMVSLVDFVHETTKEHWKRKSFSEFDYLKIDTPNWAIITIYCITILTTAGTSFFIVLNEQENNILRQWNRYSRGRI